MNQKNVGIILSYANIIVTILGNLLYTPLMLKFLGQQEYGIYSLSNSIVGYFSLLYVGLSSAYIRYYSIYKRDNRQKEIYKLNGLFLSVFSVLGIFMMLIMSFLCYKTEIFFSMQLSVQENNLIKTLLFIMSINMAFMMPKTVFAALTIARERFIFIKSLDLIRGIIMPVLSIVFLYQGFGSIGLSIVVLVCTFFDLVVNIYYCLHFLKDKFIFQKIDMRMLQDLISFSFFIVLQEITNMINWQVGKVILMSTSGSVAVAVYSVGLQFCLMFMSFSSIISGVFIPQVHFLVNSKNRNNEISALFLKVARFQYYIVFFLWIAFVFYGKKFILLWVGLDYINAYYVGLLLMSPFVVVLTQNLAIEITRAYNKHRMWNLINIVGGSINLVVSIPLAFRYGEIGIGIGNFVIMGSVYTIVYSIYYKRVIGLDMKKYFFLICKFLPASFFIILSGLVLNLIVDVNTWLAFIGNVTLFTLSYVIIMYRMALCEEEKIFIKSNIKKIKGIINPNLT